MPDHGHDDEHSHPQAASEQRLAAVALLTGAFMLVEVAGGIISGSLALLADAAHMVTDFASLALAWYGLRLARRPADWQRTYGYDRFTILAAFTNGIALFAIAIWIVAEAWQRLAEPAPILGGTMFWIALAGLAVNLLAFRILHGREQDTLNMRAAALHVAGDLLGSLAALGAAIVILLTNWTPIDPILSVLVALIISRSAWGVVGESAHILLEGAPAGVDSREIAHDLTEALPEIADVHHVHVWSITENRPMITLHARLTGNVRPDQAVSRLKQRLRERFGITHATVEVEWDGCADGTGPTVHPHLA